MTTVFCSLINTRPQLIPPREYTALRFGADESSDRENWHPKTDLNVRTSALIIPTSTETGMLWAKIAWQDPAASTPAAGKVPTKYYAKFVRDPWTELEDQTGAQHFGAVPNSQNHVTSWVGVMRTLQPLALMVMHNGSHPLSVTLAEYKAWVP